MKRLRRKTNRKLRCNQFWNCCNMFWRQRKMTLFTVTIRSSTSLQKKRIWWNWSFWKMAGRGDPRPIMPRTRLPPPPRGATRSSGRRAFPRATWLPRTGATGSRRWRLPARRPHLPPPTRWKTLSWFRRRTGRVPQRMRWRIWWKRMQMITILLTRLLHACGRWAGRRRSLVGRRTGGQLSRGGLSRRPLRNKLQNKLRLRPLQLPLSPTVMPIFRDLHFSGLILYFHLFHYVQPS